MATPDLNTTVSPAAPANIPVIRPRPEGQAHPLPQAAAQSWQNAINQVPPQAGIENPNNMPR